MSNLVKHAQKELELIGAFSEDDDFYGGSTGKAVMELIEVFSKQGHSGTSASIVAHLFNKLAKYEPIAPVMGTDDEWVEVSKGLWQNNRLTAVFKHEDGTCTYNEAVIKRCPDGTTWTGPLYLTREDAINNVNQIRVKIKSFPFTPKTFYIDMIEEEVKKDDWAMWVKDPKQLDELYAYYEKI